MKNLLYSLFLVATSTLWVACSHGMSKGPNILLIVADDLGFSDLSCYGGEIETPNLDSLAFNGLRLTRFYTTGRCCPSRVSLLTGLYPHRAGLGHMVQDLGRPGYRGRVSDDAVTIAEALKFSNYRTFMSGKWHLGTNDPTQHGFEEFYGTLVSAQTFWDADHYLRLPEGRQAISYPEGEFYGTNALTDYALQFLDMGRKTPDQPWFLYLAYNAPHFPLQAPKKDILKYADRYDMGWDEIRRIRHNRMIELGIVDGVTELAPRSQYWDWGEKNGQTNPSWDDLSEERKTDLARRMAIYAAMVDVMDQDIGQLISDLKANGELENTVIIFLSDNGACAEWDPYGFDVGSSTNNILYLEDQIEQMGQPGTYHSIGSGWANASNTPWRLYKHFNHEGGISSPCIVHWPNGLNNKGTINHQPAHLIDLMPTILDITDSEYPQMTNGIPAAPPAGLNILPQLKGSVKEIRALFFEHEGNRAVMQNRWKLSALKGKQWELYDIDSDRTELVDLASVHPDTVQHYDRMWSAWADENNVTPLPKDLNVTYLWQDE